VQVTMAPDVQQCMSSSQGVVQPANCSAVYCMAASCACAELHSKPRELHSASHEHTGWQLQCSRTTLQQISLPPAERATPLAIMRCAAVNAVCFLDIQPAGTPRFLQQQWRRRVVMSVLQSARLLVQTQLRLRAAESGAEEAESGGEEAGSTV
jgi:hypothetical protein